MHPAFRDYQTKLGEGYSITVEFLPGIEDCETYAEAGMRAKLVSVRYAGFDRDVMRLGFDFRPFDAHNLARETPNYYDRNGNACLTARESGFFKPETPEEYIYLEADRGPTEYFYFHILECTRPAHTPLNVEPLEFTPEEIRVILDAMYDQDPCRIASMAIFESAKAKLLQARKNTA